MERRPYFIIGDLLNCTLAGGAGGWLTWLVVAGGWSALPAIAAGVVIGMSAGMLVGFFCSPFFGIMEVILPAALAGMMGGMVGGLTATGEGAFLSGVPAGLLALIFIYLLQARFRGEAQ
jgi:hypothetical protein